MKRQGHKKKSATCPRCNSPVSPGAAFCESCGARVSPPPSCSLCGTLLEPGSRFCPSCGTVVGNTKGHAHLKAGEEEYPEKAPQEPAPEPEPVAEPVPEPAVKTPAAKGNAPDPLMMIPEPDVSDFPEGDEEPEDRPSRDFRKTAAKKTAAAVTTIPPVSCKKSGFLAGYDRKKIAVTAGILILIIAGAALVLAGILHLPQGEIPPVQDTPAPVMATMPEPEITEDTATVTPTVTITATPAPAKTPSLVPGPTQVPPDNFAISFEAERDPVSHMVTVLYKGGKGQMAVGNVFVRLTRSDGKVLSGTFKPTQVDSGISFPGTEKVDRLEVIVYYSTGESYTVIDKIFEYKIRN